MKQLFVLDPINQINPSKDSSAALMQAAKKASIEVDDLEHALLY